jgi:DNA-binding response OmpR family regulator
MKTRILLFEDEPAIRRPLCAFLRAQGYEVLDFHSPMACTLVAEQKCTCSRDRACADLVITDMKMPGMTGLELIRMMAVKGCRTSTKDKILISSGVSPEEAVEFQTLGCHYLPKPFQLEELLALVQACEKNIPPDRQLVPVEELWKTVCNHQ